MAAEYTVVSGGKTYPISFTTLNYALVPFIFIKLYSGVGLKKSVSGFTTFIDAAEQKTLGGIIAIGY